MRGQFEDHGRNEQGRSKGVTTMNFIKVPDAKNKPMLINLEEVAYIKTDNNGDVWLQMRNGGAVVTLDTPEEIYEILCGEGGNHNEHK